MALLGKYISDEELKAMFPELFTEKQKFSAVERMGLLYSRNGLLYIRPTARSDQPVIDEITKKITAAFRLADPWQLGFGGGHSCSCRKATSSSNDFTLPNKMFTNSLCIHYVAWHRAEVPPEQIDAIGQFTFGEIEPSPEEMDPKVTTFVRKIP